MKIEKDEEQHVDEDYYIYDIINKSLEYNNNF